MPVISTNTAANTALRYLNNNTDAQADNLARIASGSRITQAADDAAGLAIGTRMQTDVATLSQAQINTEHGVSVLSTADGGMSSINDILQRMKVLSAQSVSGTNSATELSFIQAEIDALVYEIDDIATATSFNGQSLLDGTSEYASAAVTDAGTGTTSATVSSASVDISDPDYDEDATTITFALADGGAGDGAWTAADTVTWTDSEGGTGTANVTDNGDGTVTVNGGGTTFTYDDATDWADTETVIFNLTGGDGVKFLAGTTSSDTLSVAIDEMTTTALGIGSLDVETDDASRAAAMDAIDSAIDALSAARAEVGAQMSRFEYRASMLETTSENIDAAQSAIMDADVAAEQAELASNQVKTDAAIAALAQANQLPEGLLDLLR